MASKSKAKGNTYERELVDYFKQRGYEAKRAWEVRTESIPKPKEEHEISTKEKRDKALGIMGAIATALFLF